MTDNLHESLKCNEDSHTRIYVRKFEGTESVIKYGIFKRCLSCEMATLAKSMKRGATLARSLKLSAAVTVRDQ